jgi:hypothetical protein
MRVMTDCLFAKSVFAFAPRREERASHRKERVLHREEWAAHDTPFVRRRHVRVGHGSEGVTPRFDTGQV